MAHNPHDVSLEDVGVIRQIGSLTHNINPEAVNAFGTGMPWPADMFQGKTSPASQLKSTDLATILAMNAGVFVNSGLCVGTAATPKSTDVPFRKRDTCSVHATGNSHGVLRAKKTLITPDSLGASLSESASIDCTLRYASIAGTEPAGFEPPVTSLSGQSLADAVFGGEYLLRSVVVNGVAIPELQSVNVSFGFQVDEQMQAGGPFPVDYFVTQVVPTIDITTEAIDYCQSLLEGNPLTSGGCVIYLAKRKSKAITEDATTASHIRITAVNGMRQATTFGGDSRSRSSGTIRINPQQLTAAVGVAIA